MKNIDFLKKKTKQIRIDLIKLIYDLKTGHIGESLSCTDILTVLYYSIIKIDPSNPKWEKRDRFILSRDHSVEALVDYHGPVYAGWTKSGTRCI